MIASSTNTEISWASEDGQFDEFLYLLTSAFAHQNHEGTRVNADLDGNSKITAREAYAYALTKGQRWESPLLEGSGNSNTAFVIGID